MTDIPRVFGSLLKFYLTAATCTTLRGLTVAAAAAAPGPSQASSSLTDTINTLAVAMLMNMQAGMNGGCTTNNPPMQIPEAESPADADTTLTTPGITYKSQTFSTNLPMRSRSAKLRWKPLWMP